MINHDKTTEGLIISAVGGLYEVESADSILLSGCTARGIFRKENITPITGDIVSLSDEKVICDIAPRKNAIIRPPLANLDTLVFVVSMCRPVPNMLLLDKFLAISYYKKISPLIVLTKTDLKASDSILEIYKKAGIPIMPIDYSDEKTINLLRERLSSGISAFTGNSGVGKSTLLNAVAPELSLSVGEISEKLGRGRHTTRTVRLYKMADGGYIADTPGFSTFETNRYDIIRKEELADCFPEFAPFTGKCRFHDCAHVKDKGCAVIEAVRTGEICKSRHENYCAMYLEAEKLCEWELPKQS